MALDYAKIEKEFNETQSNSEWVKIKDLPVGVYNAKIFGTKWEENKDYFGEQVDEATFMFEIGENKAASTSFVFKHNDPEDKHVKILGALKGTLRTLGVNTEGSPEEMMKRVQDTIEIDGGINTLVEIFKIEGLENNRAKFVSGDTATVKAEATPKVETQETPAQESTANEIDLDAIKF